MAVDENLLSRRSDAWESVADLALVAVGALPIVGPPATGVIQSARNVRARRVERYRDELLNSLGERVARLEEVVQGLQADERKADLIARGSQLALVADGDETVDLLAQIVADASLPTANYVDINRALVLVDVVAQLHPDHILLLRRIGDLPEHTDEQLAALMPGLAPVIAPITARLAALGLTVNARDLSRGFLGGGGGPPAWELSQFGENVIEHLRSRR